MHPSRLWLLISQSFLYPTVGRITIWGFRKLRDKLYCQKAKKNDSFWGSRYCIKWIFPSLSRTPLSGGRSGAVERENKSYRNCSTIVGLTSPIFGEISLPQTDWTCPSQGAIGCGEGIIRACDEFLKAHDINNRVTGGSDWGWK